MTYLTDRIATRMGDNPERFPTMRFLGTDRDSITLHGIDLKSIQERWIRDSSGEDFLKALIRRLNSPYDFDGLKREKATEVVREMMEEKPEVFPSGKNIKKVLKSKSIVIEEATISTWVDVETLQCEWVDSESTTNEIFFKNLKKGSFAHAKPKANDKINGRFTKMAKGRMEPKIENGEFPTFEMVREVMGVVPKTARARFIESELHEMQAEFIGELTDGRFLELSSARKIKSKSEHVSSVRRGRIRKIIERALIRFRIPSVIAIARNIGLASNAIKLNIPDIQDRIKMALALHDSKRLDELWVYGELYVLAAERLLQGSTLIGNYSSLNVFPGISFERVELEPLVSTDCRVDVRGDVRGDVIFQLPEYLTSEELANLFRNLSCMGIGDRLVLTYSNGLELIGGSIENLEEIGFEFEDFGDLYLESRGRNIHSKFLILRRIQGEGEVGSDLELFHPGRGTYEGRLAKNCGIDCEEGVTGMISYRPYEVEDIETPELVKSRRSGKTQKLEFEGGLNLELKRNSRHHRARFSGSKIPRNLISSSREILFRRASMRVGSNKVRRHAR